VKSAMPAKLAMRKCPHLIIVSPRIELYREYSKEVFKILYEYTDLVQIVSIDEAYIDVTDCKLFSNSATLIAKDMKRKIFEKLKLTCSTGISYNKLFAKIGSNYNKPNGLKTFDPLTVRKSLKEFKLSIIPGVGKEFTKTLNAQGFTYFKDIVHLDLCSLQERFGKMGIKLYYCVRGIDDREVKNNEFRKSVSVERTFSLDIKDKTNLTYYLEEVYDRFEERIKSYDDRKIKKIFIKIKDCNFRSFSLEMLANEYSYPLFEKAFWELKKGVFESVRLVGLGVKFHDLEEGHEIQLELPIESYWQIAS
jgi:DNA polymerase-4